MYLFCNNRLRYSRERAIHLFFQILATVRYCCQIVQNGSACWKVTPPKPAAQKTVQQRRWAALGEALQGARWDEVWSSPRAHSTQGKKRSQPSARDPYSDAEKIWKNWIVHGLISNASSSIFQTSNAFSYFDIYIPPIFFAGLAWIPWSMCRLSSPESMVRSRASRRTCWSRSCRPWLPPRAGFEARCTAGCGADSSLVSNDV